MPDPVLLIHGAWQGGWTWARLVSLLQAAGHRVIAADLPGNGADGSDPRGATLRGALDHLQGLIAGLGPVSVVGHSGGGLIAGALAERSEQVARLAYVAGMMLPAGKGFADVQAAVARQSGASRGITPHLQWSADRRVSTVPVPAAEAIFFNDCPSDTAHAAAERLTPQGEGTRSLAPAVTDRTATLPRLYIETTEDLSVPLAVQRHMQALMPGALVADLPTGHVPHLSAPHLLADALLPFLSGSRDAEARACIADHAAIPS